MRVVFYFMILLNFIVFSYCNIEGENNNESNKFISVCLTTIPPRYLTLYNVIKSWLNQEDNHYKPSLITIFIPELYSNFISESRHNKNKNYNLLYNELNKHFENELKTNLIIIETIKKDWGPITKYIGLIENYKNIEKRINRKVDYWIVGDDDVRYSSNTISEYMKYINNQPILYQNKILTHFKIHSRITVNINNYNNEKNNNIQIPIKHVQGVDTVLFPTSILSTTPLLSYPIISTIVTYFHTKCPNSFYQDDYLISFILSISQYNNVESIWSGIKVANHVNGVSRSGQQMHIHPNVFQREEDTKKCIVENGNEIYQIIQRQLAAEKEL